MPAMSNRSISVQIVVIKLPFSGGNMPTHRNLHNAFRANPSHAILIAEALQIQLNDGRDAAIKFLLEQDVSVQVIAFFFPFTKIPVASPDVYRWITHSTEAYISTLTAAWQPIGAQGWAHRRALAEGARQLWTEAVGKRALLSDRKRLDSLIEGMPHI
jgi:hypothetical protein